MVSSNEGVFFRSSNERLHGESHRMSVVKNVALPKGDAAGDGSLNSSENSSQVRV